MSIFPTTVLLATDGSKDAELAATTALELANNTRSELHIVLVEEPAYAYGSSCGGHAWIACHRGGGWGRPQV